MFSVSSFPHLKVIFIQMGLQVLFKESLWVGVLCMCVCLAVDLWKGLGMASENNLNESLTILFYFLVLLSQRHEFL